MPTHDPLPGSAATRPGATVTVEQPRLRTHPLELADVNAFVEAYHRHHKKVQGHRFSQGVTDEDGVLRGVMAVGRPVARKTDQRTILEVTRVCTDGCPNACSALYGAACRVQRAAGYVKVITFTLLTEPGTSLRAAGWKPVAITPGKSWSVPSRPREDKHELGQKVRWECACSESAAIDLDAYREAQNAA